MLTTLRVKNLALAENILVEFGPGLNIITGETGAGKSILMGALNLVLGGRADKSMIRAGEDACGAEAVFQLADCAVVDEILAQGDLPPCEDGQLIVRRIIKRGGGSQNRVNDASVTLQTLKQLGAWLVDMHGPHDHQSLLRNETQLQLLDAYAQNEKARVAYDGVYRQVRELERDREALLGDDEELEVRKDMLAFRVKELEEAALDPHEAEEVEKEHSVLGNAQRIQELAGGVLQALSGDEGSAYDCLVSARSALNELGRLVPDAESWGEQADTLVTLLQDLETDIQRTVGDIESSPVRLEWLDNRLAVYQKMKRKYGGSVESALEVLAESREHLQDLESRGERLATIEQDLAASRKELEAAGRALRKTRKDAARKLAKAVQRQLKALELAGGEFEVVFTEQDPGSSGMDGIDFEFAPNVGEPRSSLKAIASSGEISRVMLAMKTVLAEHDRVPVLVFDEIDANIGGETGSAVGQKLADVAQKHQVMCITHLPQVAVFGAAHYAVAKQVRDGRTSSTVTPLEEDGRVEEVARMLGGRDLTSVTLDHAREMLAANSPSD